jgi:hypothetical protein
MADSMLFDSYIMADWSGAAVPRRGKDSIWIAVLTRSGTRLRLAHLVNPPTRAAATAWLADRLAYMARRGRRALVGFDFPFGFPHGTGAALGVATPPWRGTWQRLSDDLDDSADNRNNRFDVAESLNRDITGRALPFWGNVREEARTYLVRRNRPPHTEHDPAERRLCEIRTPSSQPVWKLAGIGSVGSQAMTGIPRVWALRRDPRLATVTHIWPFETGLRHDPRPLIILAEVYPSLVPLRQIAGKPKDAAQVAAAVRHFAAEDENDSLESLFVGDPGLTARERAVVESEEAWILGVSGVSEK